MQAINNKTRILFVQHEMYQWHRAKMWGYSWHLGIEEGLAANDVEFTTLLTTCFPRAKEIVAGKKFDQVWINDITHIYEPGGCGGYQLRKKDMEWLAGLAPIRLGFVMESLGYTDADVKENQALQYAHAALQETIKYITHIMMADENDLGAVHDMRPIPAMWLVHPMPRSFICEQLPAPSRDKPIFCGTMYGKRARWMQLPEIKELIDHIIASDNMSHLPALFDKLNKDVLQQMLLEEFSPQRYDDYLEATRKIRKMALGMYLNSSRAGGAIVNLPAYAKIYPGRVYEGMAIGRPVITVQVQDRPRMQALFRDREEILLYPESDPSILVQHIRQIRDNPEFGQKLASNARCKLLEHHSMEIRVRHFLDWLATGVEPTYGSSSGDGEINRMTQNEALSLREATGGPKGAPREIGKCNDSVTPSGKKLRILFISPPYARLMGLENCRFPITFGCMATILSINKHKVAIYDADFDRNLIGHHANYEYTFTHQGAIREALEDREHYVWQEIMQEIEKFRPDVVGISTMTNKYPMAVRISEIVKSVESRIQVVIGGHHSSIFGEKLLKNENIDFAVFGEGEITMLELVNRLCEPNPDFSHIDGLIYKENGKIVRNSFRDLVENLDILPIADRDLMLNENFVSEHNLMISRGCPYDCNYCGAKIIWKRRVRKKSIPEVIKEIKYLFSRSKSRYISFWDDSFTHDRKYTFKLLEEVKRFDGFRFSCITRLDLIDKEMLIELKKAGCVNILFGVESGNDEILKLINKKTTLDSIRQKVAIVNSVGIPWVGFFIMGYPGETKENILETLRFMQELNPNYAEINIFNPLPGTQTWNELEKKSLVSSDMDFSKFSQASTENFFVKNMTQEEFKDLALFMAREFDKHNRGRNERG